MSEDNTPEQEECKQDDDVQHVDRSGDDDEQKMLPRQRFLDLGHLQLCCNTAVLNKPTRDCSSINDLLVSIQPFH